tara:strand:+ start:44 stop:1342 length:1299 start_codon:yes stop_codon:yes gene_type:complete
MKKLIFLIIFFSACGGGDVTETAITTTTTSTLGTTTTSQTNLRTLKIAIFDDSVSKKYDSISVSLVEPKKFLWSPDLEYGADDLLIPAMVVGEIGELILAFDNESKSIPICFSPTPDSKGDMATIWIVLNDNNIEVDGLAVQDIVISRSNLSIEKLNDNSKPDCDSEETTTTTVQETTTTTVQETTTTTLGGSEVKVVFKNCPVEVPVGQEIAIEYDVLAVGSGIKEISTFWSWESGQSNISNFSEIPLQLPGKSENRTYTSTNTPTGGSRNWSFKLHVTATNYDGLEITQVCKMTVLIPGSSTSSDCNDYYYSLLTVINEDLLSNLEKIVTIAEDAESGKISYSEGSEKLYELEIYFSKKLEDLLKLSPDQQNKYSHAAFASSLENFVESTKNYKEGFAEVNATKLYIGISYFGLGTELFGIGTDNIYTCN